MPEPSMQHERRDILLDVTRLISRSWTGRHSTGIDRVCYAYLRHFRNRALAVVQHRGIVRVLGPRRSSVLFDMLLGPAKGFRVSFAAWAPKALLGPSRPRDIYGLTYLNVSHTDFDLAKHWAWVRENGLHAVCFIHDLIPIARPEISRPHAAMRHTGRVRSALRYADQIITGSRAVAKDLAAYAAEEGLPCPHVTVSHIAGQSFAPPQRAAQRKPYFLCVGTIEPRKNHRLLFDVWDSLASRWGNDTQRLVVVGQTGPMTGQTLSIGQSNPHIEIRGHCPDEELAVLIDGAAALLMPSLAEGYGLPVVEALALGTRVIASDLEVFHETAQGMAMLLDPSDTRAWATAIEATAGETGSTLQQQSAKRERAARFVPTTWDAHFADIDRAIARPGRDASLKNHAACESTLAA